MKELKILKKFFKRKMSITTSLLIIFLITGKFGYSLEKNPNIHEEISTSIIVSTPTWENKGTINSNSGGPVYVDNLPKVNITNSGLIAGFDNGIRFDGSLNVGGSVSVSNSGLIASSSSDYFCSGITLGLMGSIRVSGSVSNSGLIVGSASDYASYGIQAWGDVSVNNSGLIAGYSGSAAGYGICSIGGNGSVSNSGLILGYSGSGYDYGISLEGNGSVSNSGLILGTINSIDQKNAGVMVGNKTLVVNDDENNSFTNQGITLELDDSNNIKNINIGSAGTFTLEDGTTKTIINGSKNGEIASSSPQQVGQNDIYLASSNLTTPSNVIVNAIGTNKGALVVDKDTSLNDSIVNGYNTSVFLENSNKLTATNTIFNGGGLKNDVAVIKGDTNNNSAEILGNSIINGATNLDKGDDILTLDNTIQLNGKVDGGEGNDTLNLGNKIVKVNTNLNILQDIKNFEQINTNGNITLFETIKITDANEIKLESGNLVLRIDPNIRKAGKIIGHALYENNGTLKSSGGNLVVGLNGIGASATILMGKTTISPETNDSWWKETDHIKTNSLVLDGKLSADGKEIKVTLLESIPLVPVPPVEAPVDPKPPINPPIEPPVKPEPPINPPIEPPVKPEPPINPPVEPPVKPEPPMSINSLLYEKLNKVYQSIATSGEIGSLANTTLLEDKTYNESLGALLTILDQMCANNPYAYTVKSSRDSLKLFEDNMSYLTIKPKKDEMIVQGKAIYTGVKNDNGAYGKNYYGFDTGHRNYKTTTNTVGGLATFEYGLSDKTSVGVVLGGNNQDINFKGSSKIKGNSLYLGTFAKTDINNFKFMGGVGYQYTSADADRKISNKYDSFSTGDKYDINSLNAFVEAKYIYNAEQDWTLEPKVRLSYYYIDQDKVNEGYTSGQLSMKTDKVKSNTADVEIGVDFVKSLYLNNRKLKNILSLGVINTIGDKTKELNGYILGKEKDGKKFDIQGVELPKTSGKISYNLELEQTNGMIYTTGVSLEFAKDYNRNVELKLGIGYKF